MYEKQEIQNIITMEYYLTQEIITFTYGEAIAKLSFT